MLKITGIDHIVLRTENMSSMRHFYCVVLGCHVERETDKETGLAQLRAGQALIDLIDVHGRLGREGGGPPSDTENNMDHFCLQLAPVSENELKQHFRQHGIELGEFQERYGAEGYGPSVYIQDPDGNTVELRPAMSS